MVGGKSRFDPTQKGTMEEVLAMLKWRGGGGAQFFSGSFNIGTILIEGRKKGVGRGGGVYSVSKGGTNSSGSGIVSF